MHRTPICFSLSLSSTHPHRLAGNLLHQYPVLASLAPACSICVGGCAFSKSITFSTLRASLLTTSLGAGWHRIHFAFLRDTFHVAAGGRAARTSPRAGGGWVTASVPPFGKRGRRRLSVAVAAEGGKRAERALTDSGTERLLPPTPDAQHREKEKKKLLPGSVSLDRLRLLPHHHLPSPFPPLRPRLLS